MAAWRRSWRDPRSWPGRGWPPRSDRAPRIAPAWRRRVVGTTSGYRRRRNPRTHWRHSTAERRSPWHRRRSAPDPPAVAHGSDAARRGAAAGTRHWTKPVARPRTSSPARSTRPPRIRERNPPAPLRRGSGDGLGFLVPQDGPEFFRELTWRRDAIADESGRRRRPCR